MNPIINASGFEIDTKKDSSIEIQDITNNNLFIDDTKTANANGEVEDPNNTLKNLIEDTLFISERENKVVFPYKISELQQIYDSNPSKYSSLLDVAKDYFAKPLDDYKFAPFARFREAYKLVIERAHGNKIAAVKLAKELFSNYNLNPAVIAACKSLRELDVYLSCLEYDELEDFHFFKVAYDVNPLTGQDKFSPQAIAKRAMSNSNPSKIKV